MVCQRSYRTFFHPKDSPSSHPQTSCVIFSISCVHELAHTQKCLQDGGQKPPHGHHFFFLQPELCGIQRRFSNSDEIMGSKQLRWTGNLVRKLHTSSSFWGWTRPPWRDDISPRNASMFSRRSKHGKWKWSLGRKWSIMSQKAEIIAR